MAHDNPGPILLRGTTKILEIRPYMWTGRMEAIMEAHEREVQQRLKDAREGK